MQIVMTGSLALLSGWLAGPHAALSAFLGGAVALAGGLVFALMLPGPGKVRESAQSVSVGLAWDGLATVLKAEAAKIGVIVLLLGLVLATYKQVVVTGFIGTFVLAIVIFSMAIFVRNPAPLA